MKNSKLFTLFKALNTRERTRFRHYVQSPFFNKHRGVLALLDAISPLPDQANKMDIWQQAFPNQPYHEAHLNNLLSDMLQLLYDFLAYQKYESDAHLARELLIDALLEREQFKDAAYQLKRQRQLLEKSPQQSFGYFLDCAQLEQQADTYQLSLQKRYFTSYLQSESDYLDLFYLCNKLRIACDMANRNSIIEASYDCRHLDKLLSWPIDEDTFPAVRVYKQALSMLSHRDDESHYHQFRAALAQNIACFPAAERRTLFTYALNYCIQKINIGKSQYYREAFGLYKDMLEGGTLLINQALSPWAYKNIITAGIRLQEFEWTEKFIQTYQTFLPDKDRDNALAYNLAAFYYALKDYKKALLQLQDVEFTDPSYYLGAKFIQLKSFYELGEYEAYFSMIEAFRKYVDRSSTLSVYRKKTLKRFLLVAKKAGLLYVEKPTLKAMDWQAKITELETQLEASQEVANKDWLQEILGRLRV
ncbi:MAG TPA: hypothetical protein PKA00_17920 [Saprospiraceae bacterium]|nr:hypothetical protein [Saprospiraceae bacterium]HMQ84795.1 hypothetical protein [Saprospiraceae bacterium]